MWEPGLPLTGDAGGTSAPSWSAAVHVLVGLDPADKAAAMTRMPGLPGLFDWSAPHLRTSAPRLQRNNKLTQRPARLWATAKPSEFTLPKWGLIFQRLSLSCALADPAPVFSLCARCRRRGHRRPRWKRADHVCGGAVCVVSHMFLESCVFILWQSPNFVVFFSFFFPSQLNSSGFVLCLPSAHKDEGTTFLSGLPSWMKKKQVKT